jgi:hypothetical protein
MYSKNRTIALHRVRRKNQGGLARMKYEYQCEICKGWYYGKEVDVDHIEPCGSLKEFADMPAFTERLFCLPEKLRVLCKPCHQEVTRAEAMKEHVEENTFFVKDVFPND